MVVYELNTVSPLSPRLLSRRVFVPDLQSHYFARRFLAKIENLIPQFKSRLWPFALMMEEGGPALQLGSKWGAEDLPRKLLLVVDRR